jgi:hypothetical protein
MYKGMDRISIPRKNIKRLLKDVKMNAPQSIKNNKDANSETSSPNCSIWLLESK